MPVRTGAWSFNAGTTILDYTSDAGSKFGSSTLTLGGVNLELKAGSGTQTASATSFSGGGQANISRLSGTETLALGAINNGSTAVLVTAVNFASTGIATTTNTTTNGTNVAGSILGGFYTLGSQGSADWAAVNTGTITSFTAAQTAGGGPGYTALAAGTTSGTNMLVNNSLSSTAASSSFNTLKITATDGNADTLSLTGTLTLAAGGGILDSVASSNKYTISGSSIALSTTAQYGDEHPAIWQRLS